jgi:iron complex transport system substrate-binding protein
MLRKTPAALAAACLIAPTTALAQSGFPATVKAENGKITVKKRPKRIVILSASHTETVFKIGAGRQVIAVDDQSNFPSRAPDTKLSSFRPNAEAVARYKPDLVITSTDGNKLLPSLRRLKIPTLYAPSPEFIGGAYAQMRQIGILTGRRSSAERLVRSMKRQINSVVASVPRGRRLSFFHELDPSLYSPTSATFIGRVYALFGLRNIADQAKDGGAFPQLSNEFVIAADPDFIVLADTKCCGQSAATVKRRPGWSSMTAVKRGRVVALNDDIPSRWGPRIVEFVRQVGRIITRARG